MLRVVSSICLAAAVLPVGMARAQAPASPVGVAEVVSREVTAGQSFVGTLMPKRLARVGSAVDGRVLEYPVNEGDFVKKGDPLCQLRTATLELELQGAEAELELRKQELKEAQVGPRPQEKKEAKARLEASLALREYAQSKHDRLKRLFETGRSITEDELAEALSLRIAAEQKVIENQALSDLLEEGTREEQIAQAAARVAAQEATVGHIRDRLVKHTMIAPFDGFVTAEHTEIGEWIQQSALVAEVAELSEVDVRVFVPEAYIAAVAVGQSVAVSFDALPDRQFTGQVVLVVPQADARARTFPVKVRIPNEVVNNMYVLKPGMLAQVMLPVGKPREGLLVPKDALKLGGRLPVVYVVKSDNTVAEVPVRTGVADGSLIQVEPQGELKVGDQVVVQGNERLRSGQAVRVSRVAE